MATISFHLRDRKATEPTPIFMLLYADGVQTKIKTGLRIHPDQWDIEGQKAKTRGRGVATKENGETNTDLVGMSERAMTYYSQQRRAGTIPGGVQIWETIRPVKATTATVEQAAPTGPQPLVDFADYIERTTAKSSYSTIKSKRTTLGHLTRFSETLAGPLGYADFTRAFKEKFAAYLADVAKLADNTLAKQLSILKGFLSYAAEHGFTPSIDTKGWGWKFKEPEIIALTADELAAIERLQGLQPYLENARGLFLLMCRTGLRYSDATRLRPEHDKGDHLHLVAQKTGDVLDIYVRKSVRPLLDKYWAGELRVITNQKLNAYIKELGQLAGIETPTQTIRHYGQTSRPQHETRPKWELLSCHTGRRTFVTLSIDRDVPADVVMQATGHKNFKTMQRYNQTTASRQVAASRKAWGEDD